MKHDAPNTILSGLKQGTITLDDLQAYAPQTLKSVGRKLALAYRHLPDKHSDEAQRCLALLIGVRTLVKSKMKMRDVVMERYLREQEITPP